MPVISRNRIIYEDPKGNGENIEWYEVVNFEVRTKKFSIKLPEWWHTTLGYNTVYADTLESVEYAFSRAGSEFIDLSTNRRKVILYQFEANAQIWDEVRDRMGFRENEMAFTKGTSLDFWWCIAYECTSQFNKHKKYVTDDKHFKGYLEPHVWSSANYYIGEDSDYHKYNVIEFTEERQQFFLHLQKSLDDIILKAWTFFHLDTDEVAKLTQQFKSLNALPALPEKT